VPLPRRSGLPLLAGVLTLGLLATGCGSDAKSNGGSTADHPATAVGVRVSDDGCQPTPATVPPGPVTFSIKNEGGSSVSEAELVQDSKILGEKEGLTPGLSGSFSLDLKPGSYQLYCPNAKTERTDFTVTGSAGASAASAAPAAITAATTGYQRYLQGKAAELIASTADFVAAVKAGKVSLAKSRYAKARAPYEAIEPVAESFGDLDPDIDAREGDVPAAEWGGYHRIEQQLWVKNNTAGMAPVADKLLADVKTLATRLQSSTFQAADLANGATELLTEVSKSKLTGEEERYSGTDLSDIAANLAGSRAAFDLLAPALAGASGGESLASTIRARFAAVQALMAKHATGDGNYEPYRRLTAPAIRELTVAVDALAEPLSQVAEQVVTIK